MVQPTANARTPGVFDRRGFLTLAGAAVAAPRVMPSSVLGGNAPSNRVTVAFIGAGAYPHHVPAHIPDQVRAAVERSHRATVQDRAARRIQKVDTLRPARRIPVIAGERLILVGAPPTG